MPTMSDYPVQSDNVDKADVTDNASEHVTLADMSIVDSISGDYGRIVHDTDDHYTYGDEMDPS